MSHKRMLIKGRAYCNNCKTLVTSESITEHNKCYCGGVTIIGGKEFVNIKSANSSGYSDMSVYSDSLFTEVRSVMTFKTRSKKPVIDILLKDLDKETLYKLICNPDPAIDYVKRDYIIYSFLVKELIYRSLRRKHGFIKTEEIVNGW